MKKNETWADVEPRPDQDELAGGPIQIWNKNKKGAL